MVVQARRGYGGPHSSKIPHTRNEEEEEEGQSLPMVEAPPSMHIPCHRYLGRFVWPAVVTSTSLTGIFGHRSHCDTCTHAHEAAYMGRPL